MAAKILPFKKPEHTQKISDSYCSRTCAGITVSLSDLSRLLRASNSKPAKAEKGKEA